MTTQLLHCNRNPHRTRLTPRHNRFLIAHQIAKNKTKGEKWKTLLHRRKKNMVNSTDGKTFWCKMELWLDCPEQNTNQKLNIYNIYREREKYVKRESTKVNWNHKIYRGNSLKGLLSNQIILCCHFHLFPPDFFFTNCTSTSAPIWICVVALT